MVTLHTIGAHIDWPLVHRVSPLVTCILAAVAFYMMGLLKHKKLRPGKVPWKWPSSNQLAPFSTHWEILTLAGAFYTSIIMAFSILSVHLTRAAFFLSQDGVGIEHIFQPVLEFPGLFFVFVTASLGTTALINTICLLNNSVFDIRRFDDIAESIAEFANAPGALDPNLGRKTFLIDYIPNFGTMSDHAASGRIQTAISTWLGRSDSITHFIFLAPLTYSSSALHENGKFDAKIGPRERVIQNMVAKSDHPNQDRQYHEILQEARKKQDAWETDHSGVWFTRSVGFEHYIVSSGAVVSYYVIPSEEKDDSINQVRGSCQKDVKQIRYLEDVCATYLRQAVTPRDAYAKPIEDGAGLWEVALCFDIGQPEIEHISVELFDERKSPLSAPEGRIPIEDPAGNLLPDRWYCFTCEIRPDWIKIRLRKKRSPSHADREDPSIPLVVSEPSFFVAVGEEATDCDILPLPDDVEAPEQSRQVASKDPATPGVLARFRSFISRTFPRRG